MEATRKQTWTIFCSTGYDVRPCNLDVEKAGEIIGKLKDGGFDMSSLPNARLVKKVLPKVDWAPIYKKAIQAGQKAMAECAPRPMVVQQHQNIADDNSPIEKEWFVESGVCGFAWVLIRPANCSFVHWFKKQYPTRDGSRIYADNENHIYGGRAYYGGFDLSIMDGGQSYERKITYAEAMAKVLAEEGKLKVRVGGRLD